MSLHPQIEAFLEKFRAAQLPAVADLSPAAARQQMEDSVKARGGDPTEVGHVENRNIPGPAGDMAVRIYHPQGDSPAAGWPALVYYHGGGHVIGSLDTHDGVARNLCAGASVTVVSVDYRMGPEAKFPAAVDDAYAAACWVADNATALQIDSSRLGVAGDSAGANLAAVVAIMARDKAAPAVAYQVLVYPVADYACQSASYEKFAHGYGVLEAPTMRWFANHYLRSPEDAADWRASPIKAPHLRELPPAIVVLAGHDVLHDEGAEFAAALEASGVAVELHEFEGMIHGFFSLTPMIDDAVQAQAVVCAALKQHL